MTEQIAAMEKRVRALSPEEMVAHYRFAPPAEHGLVDWLIRASWRTTDLSDAAWVRDKIMTHLLDRALELLCMQATECDPDYCYPLEEPYRFRVTYFKDNIAGLVAEPDVLALIPLIDPLIRPELERGARRLEIAEAWDAVGAAVAEAYPNPVKTHELQRARRLARTA